MQQSSYFASYNGALHQAQTEQARTEQAQTEV